MTLQEWLERISNLKAELERLGCKVEVSAQVLDGWEAVGKEEPGGSNDGTKGCAGKTH